MKLYLTRLAPAGKGGDVCERLLALLAPHLDANRVGPEGL